MICLLQRKSACFSTQLSKANANPSGLQNFDINGAHYTACLDSMAVFAFVYSQRLTKDIRLIGPMHSRIVKRQEQVDQYCARSV